MLAERARRLTPSPTLAITARARAMRAQGIDVISFGAGEPDFDTPERVKAAAVRALEQGHTKYTDTAGEDGDFDRKVRVIEEVDGQLPRVLALKPDVLVVTGDHSTPAILKGHSWHPVPFLLYSSTCRPDGIAEFGERACGRGGLGLFPSINVLPLALAHAGKLVKYGA